MDTKETHARRNPEEKSNFLSKLFFGWTSSIFWKGATRNLKVTDLYRPLKSDESEWLGNQLEKEWKEELRRANEDMLLRRAQNKKPKKQPSLFWAITRVFWARFMLQGLFMFLEITILRTLQPMIQSAIISYFNRDENRMTQNQVLGCASSLVLVTLIMIFLNHHSFLRRAEIGMCIRVACCSLMYRKVLRINQAAVNNTAEGHVTNLIGNDVARFDFVPLFLHYIWIMPLQVVLIGYLMWQAVGVGMLVGIGAMMIQTLPVQGYFSRLGAKLRMKIAAKTDDRVLLMNELISGIQVIKMYAWEKPFESLVSKVRAQEMKLISQSSYIKGFGLGITVFSERVTLYLTLITFVLMGNTLTAETTFALASLFNTLQLVCVILFPVAINSAAETSVSLERITEFLMLKEVERPENDVPTAISEIQNTETRSTVAKTDRGVEIKISNVSANWVHGQLPPTLCKISTEIQSHSLSVFVGPVGSGKSSLLHLILGELSVGVGNLSLFTHENDTKTELRKQDIRISYASQTPWLFSGSVRDNILFGQPYDNKRYQEVTRVCALRKDFEQLPQGDSTFVGERGASLSGGQRARVNLARAVYRQADIYLLDDPLSAVDTHVGNHLFEECILGFLKNKTRILVTHQLQYLQQANSILVLDRGSIKYQGSYKELAVLDPEMFDSIALEKPTEVSEIEDTYEKTIESEDASAVIEGANDELSKILEDTENHKDVDDEEVETGSMSNETYKAYFSAGGSMWSLGFVSAIFITSQLLTNGSDYWVTFWTNENARRTARELNMTSATGTSYQNITEDYNQVTHSVTEWQWFDEHGLIRANVAIYIYTALIVSCSLFMTVRSFLFMRICMNASRNIHGSMFSNLLRATMRFFNTNPSGRILNRFSKDIGAMDELLPRAMLDAIQIGCVLIGILTMIFIVNIWMIIPTIFIGGIFYYIRIYYLKTAQDIKRLEGTTKSPVFSHIISTMDGLTTIRSTGTYVEGLLREEFDRYQDTHTGAWYLTLATSTAFGFTLDLFSSLFIACLCFSFILMDDENTFGGSVGLAISQSLILTGMVQIGIRQSTEVVSQMTSVERVLQYTTLPKEGPFTSEKPPPPTWPSKGALVFKNVSMKYAANKPPVLKDLNINIKPGWKIGIVGRTGAGKTSLISALFRLTGNGLEGEIVLDGIDTKFVGLHDLRPRIAIIPQEPILFSASLRYNLDPFDQYTDAQLWDSLRDVELGDAISSLSFQVAGGGTNFSVGQRQLICLARAVLRNNRILVLDEATANVDRSTDALIQNAIKRRFADCTVLTIAHRLNTIMDSDRVLVMEEGRAVEFDQPHTLLKNPDGKFSQMVQQTGKETAKRLAAIAETKYLLSSEITED